MTSQCIIREEVVEYSTSYGSSYCEQSCTKNVILVTATCNLTGSGSYFSEGGTTAQYAGGEYSYGGSGGGSSNGGSIPPPSTVYTEEAIWNTLNQINSNSEYFIPCPELKEKLTYLVNFRPSPAIKNRIVNIPNTVLTNEDKDSWRIQDIDNAAGHMINLDYFSVKIDKLPSGFSTPEQFLEYIRLNINDFIIDHTGKPNFFEPHPNLGSSEIQNWVSGNEGALISIDITGDKGSVVLSKKESRRWIFTTIKDTYNGHHPVSGNREFGIMKLRDGTFEIYTSGADRLTMRFDQIASTMTQIFAYMYNINDWTNNVSLYGLQFVEADHLWESFLEGVTKFSEQRGSTEIKREMRVNRPNWGKVKQALDSNSPIPIDCN